MDPIQEEIQNGLRDAFKGSIVDTTGSNFIPKPEVTPEVKPEIAPEVTPEIKPDSSLTDNTVVDKTTPPVDTGAKEEVKPNVVTKSFEEQFAEKTAGKFKSWEEVETVLNTPKEEFANEQVKHWNDLAKKGIALDREFFELQSKDFENMDNPLEIRMEAMKRNPEYQDLSQKTLELELNKKYNLSEWIEKDRADYTDEDIANREILDRDAIKDREWLVNFKNERSFGKEPDQNLINERAESDRVAQSNWENFVDGLSKEVSKLSTKIDDKDSVDFDVSDADRKYAADIMKTMTKDISVFWNQFTDKDGKMDQKAVFEAILFLKNKDNIVKVSHQNALAKGKESEIKGMKNVSFEPNATQSQTKVDWRIKAQQKLEENL